MTPEGRQARRTDADGGPHRESVEGAVVANSSGRPGDAPLPTGPDAEPGGRATSDTGALATEDDRRSGRG